MLLAGESRSGRPSVRDMHEPEESGHPCTSTRRFQQERPSRRSADEASGGAIPLGMRVAHPSG